MLLDGYLWSCESVISIAEVIRNPGPHLESLRREVRERTSQTVGVEQRRGPILQALADKQAERDRVVDLHRRGRISAEEADRALDGIAMETDGLRRELESANEERSATDGLEKQLTDAATIMGALRSEVDDIEQSNDLAAKRHGIEHLVEKVIVATLPSPRKHRKPYRLTLEVRFASGPVDVWPSANRTTTSKQYKFIGG